MKYRLKPELQGKALEVTPSGYPKNLGFHTESKIGVTLLQAEKTYRFKDSLFSETFESKDDCCVRIGGQELSLGSLRDEVLEPVREVTEGGRVRTASRSEAKVIAIRGDRVWIEYAGVGDQNIVFLSSLEPL